jgi:DNA-binding NarL/FixJ family response regulator
MTESSGGDNSAEQARITVFLLDDHEIVRRGVRDLLSAEPDIDVIGEAGTAAAALQRMPALRPDVAVLDVRLPDGDGVSVCREIRSTLPGTACLMLTSYGDDQALLGAIMAGAAGYVLKQTCGSDLVSAVRTVAAGGSTLDAHAANRVMARLRERMDSVDPLSALTEQEKKVLDLVGEGLTNRQIAERMFLAEKTAKNYVSSLLTKLGMQRRAQAAAFSARLAEHQADLLRRSPGRAAAGVAAWTCPAGPRRSTRARAQGPFPRHPAGGGELQPPGKHAWYCPGHSVQLTAAGACLSPGGFRHCHGRRAALLPIEARLPKCACLPSDSPSDSPSGSVRSGPCSSSVPTAPWHRRLPPRPRPPPRPRRYRAGASPPPMPAVSRMRRIPACRPE